MTKPEALRLADALERGTYLLSRERDTTAAELRLLHAEVQRLEKANRLLQQHHATAWNRGHTMGMHANSVIAKQALDAVKNDAWGNTQLTEALMAAEAENEALRAALEKVVHEFAKHGRHHWPEAVVAKAALDARRSTA